MPHTPIIVCIGYFEVFYHFKKVSNNENNNNPSKMYF